MGSDKETSHKESGSQRGCGYKNDTYYQSQLKQRLSVPRNVDLNGEETLIACGSSKTSRHTRSFQQELAHPRETFSVERTTSKMPNRKFKRPRSYYIDGRVFDGDMLEMGESSASEARSERWFRDRANSSSARDVNYNRSPERRAPLSQEDKEKRALDRINYLNRKLKAGEARGTVEAERICAPTWPTVEPELPAWSYETYSGSERRAESLSGLRSYMWTSGGRVDGLCHNRQSPITRGLEKDIKRDTESLKTLPTEAYLEKFQHVNGYCSAPEQEAGELRQCSYDRASSSVDNRQETYPQNPYGLHPPQTSIESSLTSYLDGKLVARQPAQHCSLRLGMDLDSGEEGEGEELAVVPKRRKRRRSSKHRRRSKSYHNRHGSTDRVKRLEVTNYPLDLPQRQSSSQSRTTLSQSPARLPGRTRKGSKDRSRSRRQRSASPMGARRSSTTSVYSRSPSPARKAISEAKNAVEPKRKIILSIKPQQRAITTAAEQDSGVGYNKLRLDTAQSGSGYNRQRLDNGGGEYNKHRLDGKDKPNPVKSGKRVNPALIQAVKEASMLGHGDDTPPPHGQSNSLAAMGDMFMQSTGASPPMLQAQEAPLAIDNGYCMPEFGDDDCAEMPLEAKPPKVSRQQRLVVRKNRSSARIWSAPDGEKPSRSKSRSRLYPSDDDEEDCDEENSDEDEEEEEEEEKEKEVVSDGGETKEDTPTGDAVSDLITQTEMSTESNLQPSDKDGYVADVECTQAHDSDISKIKPDTGDVAIINSQVLNSGVVAKIQNKSQNNRLKGQSDTSTALDTTKTTQTVKETKEKRYKSYRKHHSPEGSVKNKTTTSYQKSPQRKAISGKEGFPRKAKLDTIQVENSKVNKNFNKAFTRPPTSSSSIKDERNEKRLGYKKSGVRPRSSPPLPPSFPEDREVSQGTKEEIEVPMGHDGTARILLVLKTPPKTTSDGTRSSPGIMIRSVSPNKESHVPNKESHISNKESHSSNKDLQSSNKEPLRKARTTSRERKPSSCSGSDASPKFRKSKENLRRREGTGDFEDKESPRRTRSTQKFISNSPSIRLKQQYAGDGVRNAPGKFRIDSLVPKRYRQANPSQHSIKSGRTLQVTSSSDSDSSGSSSDSETDDDIEVTVEQSLRSLPGRYSIHTPCKRGSYSPPSVSGNLQLISSSSTLNAEKRTKLILNRRGSDTDRSPCNFSRYAPCNHEEHTPCRFDPRTPCMHDECEKPQRLQDAVKHKGNLSALPKEVSLSKERPATASPCKYDRYRPCHHEDASDCSSDVTDLLVVKEVARERNSTYKKKQTGFNYVSKALQEKYATHSPCTFDRWKPCLHEECLGSTGGAKNIPGVSLLAHAAKNNNPNKSDPSQIKCRFNPYTPCFHDEDTLKHLKINKALGRKASWRPERRTVDLASDSKGSEEKPATISCKFTPYKPCFCQEAMEAQNIDPPQKLNQTEDKKVPEDLSSSPSKKAVKGRLKAISDKTESSSTNKNYVAKKESSSTNRNYVGRKKKSAWLTNERIKDKPATNEPIKNTPATSQVTAGKPAANELTPPVADGPGLKVGRTASPVNAKVAVGAGDGEKPKSDNNSYDSDDEVDDESEDESYSDLDESSDETESANSMSIMTRISRAWFSSAQAQVARLAPPQNVIVQPNIRPDTGLGSAVSLKSTVDVPDEGKANATVDATAVGALAAAAAAAKYSPLQKQKEDEPQAPSTKCAQEKHKPPRSPPGVSDTLAGDVSYPQAINASNNIGDTSVKQDNFHWGRQGVYELSLAESRTAHTCDVDTSQVSVLQEPSGWTTSSHTKHGARHHRARSGSAGKASPPSRAKTEKCGGQPETTEQQLPVTQQLWKHGNPVPEDFLVLTSNHYPLNVSPGAGDVGSLSRGSKRVDVGVEVLSADPLPAHFSDVGKVNKTRQGGLQMMKETKETLYTGRAGVTLCNSAGPALGLAAVISEGYTGGWTADNHHHLMKDNQSLATLDGTTLRHVNSAGGVKAVPKKICSFKTGLSDNRLPRQSESKEETNQGAEGLVVMSNILDDESREDFTTRGDVCANPLRRRRHPRPQAYDVNNALVRTNIVEKRLGNSASHHMDHCSAEVALGEQAEDTHRGNEVSSAPGYGEIRALTREITTTHPEVTVDALTDSRQLPSKEQQAMVVAASELASYKSLLDTIHKIARTTSSHREHPQDVADTQRDADSSGSFSSSCADSSSGSSGDDESDDTSEDDSYTDTRNDERYVDRNRDDVERFVTHSDMDDTSKSIHEEEDCIVKANELNLKEDSCLRTNNDSEEQVKLGITPKPFVLTEVHNVTGSGWFSGKEEEIKGIDNDSIQSTHEQSPLIKATSSDHDLHHHSDVKIEVVEESKDSEIEDDDDDEEEECGESSDEDTDTSEEEDDDESEEAEEESDNDVHEKERQSV